MEKRKDIISALVANRYKYSEIGRLLGISRQRVHQIATGWRIPPEHHKVLTAAKRKLLGMPTDIIPDGFINGGRDRFRELVRIRDGHTCQICRKVWNEGARRFDVHHQDEELEGLSDKKGACKMDKENFHRMITLCHKCHLNLDSVRFKMKNGHTNVGDNFLLTSDKR